MHGQVEHAPAETGDRAVAGRCAKRAQELVRLFEGTCGRVVDERRPIAPRGEFEGERREVDHFDLRRAVLGATGVLDLAPQPVRHSRCGATGASGPLVGRSSAGGNGGEAGHPGARIEARFAAETCVDDDADPCDGERRLGDVGGQDHATSPRRGRCERLVLDAPIERAGEGVDPHVRPHRGGERRLDSADLAHTGEKHQNVAVVVGQCTDHGGGRGVHEILAASASCSTSACASAAGSPPFGGGRRAPPAHVDVVRAACTLHHRRIEEVDQRVDVGCCRHCHDAQIWPDRRGDIGQEGHAYIGRQVALVHLVEQHRGNTGQLGIALQAASEDPFGEHLDARVARQPPLVTRLVADEIADFGPGRGGHASSGSSGRQPPRLEHDDPTIGAPRSVEQGQWHHGGLAGAWRGDQDRPPMVGQRGGEVVERLSDR